ncbi:photosystem I reaction center protein PsaF subunit III [Gloeothece citriformis PCC 7424]|uniref:Photosystem I reaction center subunit III n=1 Tax=Gloeothece citriformis (strain PCC 7424) TaxID=65393 RepID=B7K766_GLOC7|nr:photosystem I reaction center protein PsaF subunit III [Gloeothece citriformis]ACK69634.1 photosystem I reaction center protein PsaF subunit III [Gloeothece citriformis PCC 7424]
MRRLLAIVLVLTVWFTFVPPASADFANLTPCSESPTYQTKAKNFRNTTGDPNSGENRAERYSQALCDENGYPHLIVDGRWSHIGDFTIPSLLFLYIAGWIGWAGRSYLIAIQGEKDPEMKEIIIDVPLAISKMLGAALWPLAALGEFTSGKLVVKDVPVSPR